MKKQTVTLLVLLLAVVAAGSAQAAVVAGNTQAAGPISNLRYSPKPLYNDELTVAISFTTSRKARPGYEWGVILWISGKEPPLSCASILSSWDPAFGGNAKRHLQRAGKHSVLLVGKIGRELEFICRGKAHLSVVEHKIGSPGLGRPLGASSELEFRVAQAP